MSLLYIIIGINHFTNPALFTAIVPPFLIYKDEIVYLSGLIEIIMGILLLIKKTRTIGSWGVILLLICVFPANVYLYNSEIAREALHISKNQALIRLPFQIPLIILAYWHSKESNSKRLAIICTTIFIPTIIYFITI